MAGMARQHEPTPANAPTLSRALPANTPNSATGDVVAGRLVFRKCQACHSLQAGKELVGPSLAGIIGRKAADRAGLYLFRPAMKRADITWGRRPSAPT